MYSNSFLFVRAFEGARAFPFKEIVAHKKNVYKYVRTRTYMLDTVHALYSVYLGN